MRRLARPGAVLTALVVLLVLLFPWLSQSSYYQGLFILTFIWIIMNQGLNILLGFTGYASIQQGAMFGLAAYVTAICTTAYHWNVWLAAVFAVLVNGVAASLMALIVFRTDGAYFAILTLCVTLIAEELFTNLGITGGSEGIPNIPSLFPATWPSQTFYYFSFLLMMATIGVYCWLRTSRLGYALRGIGANERLAASVGVHLYKYKTIAFVLAGMFAGVSGVLYACYENFVSPLPFGASASMSSLLAVVIGGTGTVWGPILGSVLLVYLPQWLQSFQQYQLTVYGILVILIIHLMPRGLVGVGQSLWRFRKAGGALPVPAESAKD
ncbi:MAG: branched-chain amino acid ABC transporter permease [Alicyclobacillaceae bacterium]|nr:branched-chain amino acid ABC transporter permease [Alicyclobacillaceae bacterium]